MNRCILVGMILTLAIAFARPSAFAQAAAESVLLNANSATATVKAGSALGSALNRVNKQLAGRVSQQTSPPAPGKMSQVGPVSTSPDLCPHRSAGFSAGRDCIPIGADELRRP